MAFYGDKFNFSSLTATSLWNGKLTLWPEICFREVCHHHVPTTLFCTLTVGMETNIIWMKFHMEALASLSYCLQLIDLIWTALLWKQTERGAVWTSTLGKQTEIDDKHCSSVPNFDKKLTTVKGIWEWQYAGCITVNWMTSLKVVYITNIKCDIFETRKPSSWLHK